MALEDLQDRNVCSPMFCCKFQENVCSFMACLQARPAENTTCFQHGFWAAWLGSGSQQQYQQVASESPVSHSSKKHTAAYRLDVQRLRVRAYKHAPRQGAFYCDQLCWIYDPRSVVRLHEFVTTLKVKRSQF